MPQTQIYNKKKIEKLKKRKEKIPCKSVFF